MTACWMNLGQNLKINAKKFPNTVCLKDSRRSFTYPQTNTRVNRLSHSLTSLGLSKGDKLAVLLENSIEIIELYLATAKTGIVIVPINFRLTQVEVDYIVENSDAKAIVVHDQFTETIDAIRTGLKNIPAENAIVVGEPKEGYRPYEEFIMDAPEDEPHADVRPEDTWILIYTSGTTGKPKGVVHTHAGFPVTPPAGCWSTRIRRVWRRMHVRLVHNSGIQRKKVFTTDLCAGACTHRKTTDKIFY